MTLKQMGRAQYRAALREWREAKLTFREDP